MKDMKLNETPVRTSKNFNINNIKLENISFPNQIESFKNVKILTSPNACVSKDVKDFSLLYGIGEFFEKQVKENANQKICVTINEKESENVEATFSFDEKNLALIDNFQIIANKGSKATVVVKYLSEKDINCYHNGTLNLVAGEDSEVHVILINFMNTASQNFISIQNELESNAKVKYTIVDFGGKSSITNYYSNLLGESSENYLNTIYLGTEEQLFDLNYIGELRGKKSNVDIEVQGALKDSAKKHFKGTIDFKKGAKKSKGNENEFCMLLSNKAKSLALPMLLCSEEDVEGNHSSSAGKIGEKELFYIMSRGFELKEAMKLMVRARFNNIIENIKDEKLRNEILEEIDKRLD